MIERDNFERKALRDAMTAQPSRASAWLGLSVASLVSVSLLLAWEAGPQPWLPVLLCALASVWTLRAVESAAAPRPRYLAAVLDAVGDLPVLAATAWMLAPGPARLGAAAVAAIGAVMLGAYAEVRGTGLGFRIPVSRWGSPERLQVVAVGLVSSSSLLEPALWLVSASGLLAMMRVTLAVWRQNA